MAAPLPLRAGELTLAQLRAVYERPAAIALDAADRERIARASELVERIVARGDAAYGINTGSGLLAQTRIPDDQLEAASASTSCCRMRPASARRCRTASCAWCSR